MVASLGTPMNNAVFEAQEKKDIPNLFPLSSARSMTDPLHRLKFGALSSYYDQIRAGVKWAINERGKIKYAFFIKIMILDKKHTKLL